MKKILSIFCATVAFVLTSAAEQAQSAADKKTGIEVEEKKSAKSAAEKSALEKNPPRVRTRAERAAAAKSAEASESAAAAKDSGDSQSSDSESAGDSVEPIKTRATPPKRDSIWDHMFPF